MRSFKPDEKMLQNYLQNKLTPQDEEQLELWLADHPEALEDMELDLMMKVGVTENTFLNDALAAKPFHHWKSLAIAASVALTVVSALLLQEKLLHVPMGVIYPNSFVLSHNRSDNTEIIKLKKTEHALLQIPVSVYLAGNYKLSIKQSERTLFESDDVAPELGVISLVISKQTYPVGIYQLILTNQNSLESQAFQFQIED
jgi:hypothetical protein